LNDGSPSSGSDTGAPPARTAKRFQLAVPRLDRVPDGAVRLDEEQRRHRGQVVGARHFVGCRLAERRHSLAVLLGVASELVGRVLPHRDDPHTGVGQGLHLGRRHDAHRTGGLEERQHHRPALPRVVDDLAGIGVGKGERRRRTTDREHLASVGGCDIGLEPGKPPCACVLRFVTCLIRA
jgi:hypothetical protein